MLTLGSSIARTVRLHGCRPAILDGERRLTWAEFGNRIASAATVLRGLGLEPGERYAILAHNSFCTSELMHAGYWMGSVPVPINYRLAPPEIADLLADADCRLLVIEDAFAGLLRTDELAPWSEKALHLAAGRSDVSWPHYQTLFAYAKPGAPQEVAEEDDALLLYTGGTTGRSKGVRLSHRNILVNALQIAFECGTRAGDVYLHVAPMFHSADLLSTAYTLAGASHVFLPRFSGRAVLESIQTYGVTSTMLTPTMIYQTLKEPRIVDYDLSSLRLLIYGSSPMAVEWIERALAQFEQVEMVQGYGLTETSPILTFLSGDDHRRAVETGAHAILRGAGRPLPGVDIKIVDESGCEVPTGKPGEVVVRGPNVCKGYLNRPEAMTEAFHDGWFFSGDIGYLDERGYLYLLDRKNDMIITGSEIVFSLEVEAALHQHPKVAECAVVGVPDEQYGEALLAAVVTTEGEALTDEELIAHCRNRIGGFKIPRHYVFLEELPKSAMNKVLKGKLRQLYAEQLPA